MTQAEPRTSIYHPRYWGLWTGIGLFWLLARLPHALQLRFGRGFGRMLYHLARKRRRITETNIALCFPHLDPAGQSQLVRAAFESSGMGIVETAIAWLRGVDHLADRHEIHGLEHLEQARAGGRGVLLLGAHFSTLDIAGALTSRHIELDVVERRNPHPVWEYLQRRGREQYFGRIYYKSETRDIIRGLQEGRIVWYAQDQNVGRRQAIFAPFFGIQAATSRGAARLATITGARVLFYSYFRLDGGRRYRLVFSPLDDFPSGDEIADATRINRLIETALQEHPEQYWWLHRRFKTRPPGEASIY